MQLARYLDAALDSVAAQTYRPLEVLIIDDGSTDESAQVITDAQRRLDIQISYTYQHNQGPSAARNRGIAQANGVLVAFLDADDVWLPQKLTQQTAHLVQNPMAGAAVCRAQYILEPHVPWPTNVNRAHCEQSPPCFFPSALIVRTEVFKQVGIFNPDIRIGEDTDWIMRARDAGIDIVIVQEILLQRRFHEHNLSLTATEARSELFGLIRTSLKRRTQAAK
ncbi:MAG: glycosyltransferase family A protein [Caldilineaceae bacterium]